MVFEIKNGTKMTLRVDSTDLMALTHIWLIKEYSKHEIKINKTNTVIDVGGTYWIIFIACVTILYRRKNICI
jgi:hypothetical protein